MHTNALSESPTFFQKRTSDPTNACCELPCDCWEVNSGPLESSLCSYSLSYLSNPIKFLKMQLGNY